MFKKEFDIELKNGFALSDKEFDQINKSLIREFNIQLEEKEKLKDRLFFLLKNKSTIVAFGALLEMKHVYFNDEEFSLMGIVSIVSNTKNKGYGRQVLTAISRYLHLHAMTGIGFTFPKNKGFYKKCGFMITHYSTPQFIVKKGNEKMTNTDGQIIFYQNGSDEFMQKVLSHPDKEVLLPESNLW